MHVTVISSRCVFNGL